MKLKCTMMKMTAFHLLRWENFHSQWLPNTFLPHCMLLKMFAPFEKIRCESGRQQLKTEQCCNFQT